MNTFKYLLIALCLCRVLSSPNSRPPVNAIFPGHRTQLVQKSTGHRIFVGRFEFWAARQNGMGCDKNMLLMSGPAVRHFWRYSSSIKTFVHITEKLFLSQIQGPSWFEFKIRRTIFVTSDVYNSVQTLSFWSQMSSDKGLSSCNHGKGIFEPFKVYNGSSFSFLAFRSTLMSTPCFIIQ